MPNDDRTQELLAEILETQRAHLEEYKRVTRESLRLQRKSVESQARYLRILRPTLVVGAIVIAGLLVYVLWLGRYLR